MTDALRDEGVATSSAAANLIAAGLSLSDELVVPRR
ncbi:MAG: hypothetical protein QOE85_1497, partial [Actinomycetota bacterium]|nr:hypothetical protein [Actinomycetota bacterium]